MSNNGHYTFNYSSETQSTNALGGSSSSRHKVKLEVGGGRRGRDRRLHFRFSKGGINYDDVSKPELYEKMNQMMINFSDSSVYQKKPPKHPPHLVGNDIGLYYRDLARKRAASKIASMTQLRLQSKTKDAIEQLLSKSQELYSEGSNQYQDLNESQFKTDFLSTLTGDLQKNITESLQNGCRVARSRLMDNKFLEELNRQEETNRYKKLLKFRAKLPTYAKKDEILDIVENNQVVVISGETGCGKTTQIAQFLLDHQIKSGNGSVTKIACTQPRRISAISVAERVSAERNESLGDTVGYQIRLEKILPRDMGSILYCTTGILLQYLRTDPALLQFSHIILDEIHERSTQSDFLITVLKRLIPKRPDLKVLLMSATLNPESFSEYFDNCPIIHIPGFTFPVTEYYLEDILTFTMHKFESQPIIPNDYTKFQPKNKILVKEKAEYDDTIKPYVRELRSEAKYSYEVTDQLMNMNSEQLDLALIEKLIRWICQHHNTGSILVFLPGILDITSLIQIMSPAMYPEDKYLIYPLHSRLPTIDQKAIFETPPLGQRKIIVSTSIAETSITIDDVVYVIDSGKTKFTRLDFEKNIDILQAEWECLANAKQRRGRAGRVKAGHCFYMFTRARESTLQKYPTPEVLRTRLEDVILQTKILQLGKAETFLASLIDPPQIESINLSLELLKALNALDQDENLTPLGYHLAQLPLNPRTGKMIILSALFSCVEPVCAIAASLDFKDGFYTPRGEEDEAKKEKLEFTLGENSDHIAFATSLTVFEELYKIHEARQYCRDCYLSFQTMKMLSNMKTQFIHSLFDMRFLSSKKPSDPSSNRNSDNIDLVKAIVCAGLFPNLANPRRIMKNGFAEAWTPEDGCVRIHPSSVNYKIQTFPTNFITYFTKQKSTAIYLHDTTFVTPSIVLFAGFGNLVNKNPIRYIDTRSIIEQIDCDDETKDLVGKLGKSLNNLLEYKITHPGVIDWAGREGNILNAIILFISEEITA